MAEPLPSFDLYEALEVSPTASTETIEAVWRSIMKRTHPDVAGASGAERARRANIAHDWLADPVRRAEYDRSRPASPHAGRTPRTPPAAGPRPAPAAPADAPAATRYPVPLETGWTLPGLILRASQLTAEEAASIHATAKRLTDANDYGFPGLSRVKEQYVAAATSKEDADARRRQVSTRHSPAWPAYLAANKATESGAACAHASAVALAVHEAAEGLIWRDALTPREFSRVVHPWVHAVGEPGDRWSAQATGTRPAPPRHPRLERWTLPEMATAVGWTFVALGLLGLVSGGFLAALFWLILGPLIILAVRHVQGPAPAAEAARGRRS